MEKKIINIYTYTIDCGFGEKQRILPKIVHQYLRANQKGALKIKT